MTPAEARPTARSCDTSSRQVAQSNSTLSAWLPDRRQPSWLTSAASATPTPRAQYPTRSPRSRRHPRRGVAEPESTPPLPGTTNTTAAEIIEITTNTQCPERSSSSSPPSTIPQSPVVRTLPILPSPAPSNEGSSTATSADRSAQVAITSLLDPVTTMIPQSGVTPASTTLTDHETINAARNYDFAAGRTSRLTVSQPPSGSVPTVTTASIPSSITQSGQANFPAPTSTLPSQQSQRHDIPSTENEGAQKKRRVLPKDYELLQSWGALRKLEDLVRRCGGEQQLNPALEQPRILLLRDACETGDLFYVVLHQLFCTWTVNPGEVHGLFRGDTASCSKAELGLRTLSGILKDNASMRPDLLDCLANFPAPFAKTQRNAEYSSTLYMVVNFLFCVANSWTDLMSKHAAHGFPLLMDELLRHLQMYSDILQVIVFRASRRTAGVPDSPIGTQMESIFRQDQDFHRCVDGSFKPKEHDSSYMNYNGGLIKKYKELVQAARTTHGVPSAQRAQQQPAYCHPSGSTSTNMLNNGQSFSGYNQSPVAQSQQWTVLPSTNAPTTDLSQSNNSFHPQPITVSNHNSAVPMAAAGHWLPPASQPSLSVGTVPSHGPLPHTMTPVTIMPAQQPNTQPIFASTRTQQATFNSSAIANFAVRGPSELVHSPVTMAAGMSGQFPMASPMIQTNNAPNTLSVSGNHNAPAFTSPQSRPPQTNPPNPRSLSLLFPDRDYRIPINEYPSDQYDTNCIIHTLHQADIRSPRRLPDQLEEASERHYQSIRKLALRPVSVVTKAAVHKFKFHLSNEDRSRLAPVEIAQDSLSRKQRYSNGSLRVRVRCCYVVSDQAPSLSDSDWAMKHVTWPEHIFLELNHVGLSIRRKAHYGKDLPIEVPVDVLSDENYLHVWVPETTSRPRDIPKDSQPYLAVELVETLSHSAILSLVEVHGIQPSSFTLSLIEKRLSSKKDSDDDEVAVVTPEIAIDLADPFTSGIFKIPVRGIDCTHLECFDLETWLKSRLGKRKTCVCDKWSSSCKTCPSEPSFVDKWKCPLCSADARPYSLRIDEWLVGVRKKLEADGHLGAKSILVAADGTWKIKELPANDEDEGSGGEDDKAAGLGIATKHSDSKPIDAAFAVVATSDTPRAVPTTTPVVIEIEDD